jgi:hypothetical protein
LRLTFRSDARGDRSNEVELEHVLRVYMGHFNEERPH